MKLYSIEEDIEKITSNIPNDKLILITHAPPYNTNCDYTKEKNGKLIHVGSKAVRKFIEKRQPLLSLHGHIHDTIRNTEVFPDYLGKSVCASVGNEHTGEHPYIIEVEIGKTFSIKRERL